MKPQKMLVNNPSSILEEVIKSNNWIINNFSFKTISDEIILYYRIIWQNNTLAVIKFDEYRIFIIDKVNKLVSSAESSMGTTTFEGVIYEFNFYDKNDNIINTLSIDQNDSFDLLMNNWKQL